MLTITPHVARQVNINLVFFLCFKNSDPPTFIEPLHDITVVERGQGLLDCSVDGIPYPTVRFMKDWRPMTDTSRLVVTNDPQKPERWTMAINEAIPTDSGSYMCVAENVAGKIYSTSRVNVEGWQKHVNSIDR